MCQCPMRKGPGEGTLLPFACRFRFLRRQQQMETVLRIFRHREEDPTMSAHKPERLNSFRHRELEACVRYNYILERSTARAYPMVRWQ